MPARRRSDQPRDRRQAGTRPDNPRRVAYDLLRAVETRDAYANLLLPSLFAERGLRGRDAALATELSYGTLRGRGTYDAIIAVCSDRRIAEVEPRLLDVLRLGAHQLLRTRIPAHAAVAATVDLAKAAVGGGAARYANAVLRKIATRDLDGWLSIVAPPLSEDPIGRLSVVYSHPPWVVSALYDALDRDLAETAALLAANNERPRVTLLAKPGRASVAELLAAGAEPAKYAPYAAYLQQGDPAAVRAIRERRAAVVDEASQLVTLALARIPLDGSDGRWLDLCAGPGGKAALASGIAVERGACLLAADLQPHRARLVRSAVGDQAAVVVADGTAPAWRSGSFDRVLVDVPCTGLGALRRRPEARWRRTPEDVDRLGPLQRALLGSAVDAVRPGGVVGYATCSPHLGETRGVVEAVISQRDDVEVLEARDALPEVDDLGWGPYAQFWPHRHGTDAMFLALLRRR